MWELGTDPGPVEEQPALSMTTDLSNSLVETQLLLLLQGYRLHAFLALCCGPACLIGGAHRRASSFPVATTTTV